MAKRKPIGKQLRFEVFKRDGFKCQYCGCSAPDVILHVDHIDPVSKGGDNDIMNLITSCQACNLGKSDRTLDDKSSVEKQRKQLQELNERREQLEMMLHWRDELKAFGDEVVEAVVEKINEMMEVRSVNESGVSSVRKWLKRFSAEEILDAAEQSAERYLSGFDQEVNDFQGFFDYIPRLAAAKKKPEAERRILYARGILRNRLAYVNEKAAVSLMRDAVSAGADIEEIIELAKEVKNWTEFRGVMEGAING